MTSIKEDVKDVSISLALDLMLVVLIISWILAIVLTILEVSLWIVFGIFLVGCGLFFALLYLFKKEEEKEKNLAITEEVEILD